MTNKKAKKMAAMSAAGNDGERIREHNQILSSWAPNTAPQQAAVPATLPTAEVSGVGRRAVTAANWAVAGLGGTGVSVLIYAVARQTTGHSTHAGLWAAVIAVILVSGIIGCLGMWMTYRVDKIYAVAELAIQQGKAAVTGQLAQTYHDVMVKAAGEAHHSEHYIGLSDAMARHAAVLNNGVCPADDTHHKLYRYRP